MPTRCSIKTRERSLVSRRSLAQADETTFQQAFEGGTWGGTGPTKPLATHSEKRRGMRDAPALLSHLCSPFVNDPTGLTTSFFCVRAMRRGPVPTISSAFNTRTK